MIRERPPWRSRHRLCPIELGGHLSPQSADTVSDWRLRQKVGQAGRVWTPRWMQAKSDLRAACGQVLTCVRPLDAALLMPRARMEMRGSGPIRLRALEAPSGRPGFPNPVSMTVCPYPWFDLPTSSTASKRRSLMQAAPELDRPHPSPSAPKPCAPSCWQEPR